MCIGVPGRIIKIAQHEGVVEVRGVRQKVVLSLVPEAELGDYVLIHAGMAIQFIEEQDAQLTLDLLEEWLGNEPCAE